MVQHCTQSPNMGVADVSGCHQLDTFSRMGTDQILEVSVNQRHEVQLKPVTFESEFF
jgi:hypothetical protein